jgi:hypothetical protein
MTSNQVSLTHRDFFTTESLIPAIVSRIRGSRGNFGIYLLVHQDEFEPAQITIVSRNGGETDLKFGHMQDMWKSYVRYNVKIPCSFVYEKTDVIQYINVKDEQGITKVTLPFIRINRNHVYNNLYFFNTRTNKSPSS